MRWIWSNSGEADIAIGPNWNRYDEQFEATVLYQAPFACAMREGHPLAGSPLTLEAFASVPQIMISQPGDLSRHIDRISLSTGYAVALHSRCRTI